MAKPLPKTPKKAKLDRVVARALEGFEETTDERIAFARKFLEAQDDQTQEVIRALADRMMNLALATSPDGRVTGYVHFDGKKRQVVLKQDVWERNYLYYAVKVMIELASMDIRVAKFTMPKLCATCGKAVGK